MIENTHTEGIAYHEKQLLRWLSYWGTDWFLWKNLTNHSHSTVQGCKSPILAQVVSIPVGWRLGSRLATPLVAIINYIIFSPIFCSGVYFSHRRHLFRLRRPFWAWAAILDIAGGERVPPAPLGWYSVLFCVWFGEVIFSNFLGGLYHYITRSVVAVCFCVCVSV